MNMLERAIAIAVQAHAGQVDKAGAPYIMHSLRVMLSLKSQEEQLAGVLHDIIEDTDWTLERLKSEGFSECVIEAIDALTRRAGEEYFEFIERLAENKIGLKVKLADLKDNSDLTRINTPTDKDCRRVKKYNKAIEVLNNYIMEHEKVNK